MWKFQQCHRGVCSWPAFVANAGEGWRRGGKNDRPSVLLLSFNTDEDCPQKKNKNKPTNKRSPGLPLTFIQLEQRHVFGKASLIRRRPIEPKRTGLASVTQSCYNLEQFFPRTELETHVKIKTTLVIIAHNIWEPGCLIGELHSERIGGEKTREGLWHATVQIHQLREKEKQIHEAQPQTPPSSVVLKVLLSSPYAAPLSSRPWLSVPMNSSKTCLSSST